MSKKPSKAARIIKGVVVIVCSIALLGIFWWWSQGSREYSGRRHPAQLIVFGLLGIGYGTKLIFFTKD